MNFEKLFRKITNTAKNMKKKVKRGETRRNKNISKKNTSRNNKARGTRKYQKRRH